MPWPPQVGELLPRYDEPIGIARRLRTYSLVSNHKRGGAKANGFLVMLGIGLESIDYLELTIREGIADTRISSIRPGVPDGLHCTVQFQIAGRGGYSHRVASLRTGWELTGPGA